MLEHFVQMPVGSLLETIDQLLRARIFSNAKCMPAQFSWALSSDYKPRVGRVQRNGAHSPRLWNEVELCVFVNFKIKETRTIKQAHCAYLINKDIQTQDRFLKLISRLEQKNKKTQVSRQTRQDWSTGNLGLRWRLEVFGSLTIQGYLSLLNIETSFTLFHF